MYVWRSEDNFAEFVLSSTMGSRKETQVVKFGHQVSLPYSELSYWSPRTLLIRELASIMIKYCSNHDQIL